MSSQLRRTHTSLPELSSQAVFSRTGLTSRLTAEGLETEPGPEPGNLVWGLAQQLAFGVILGT